MSKVKIRGLQSYWNRLRAYSKRRLLWIRIRLSRSLVVSLDERGLGDYIVFTAFIRDLAQHLGGRLRLKVENALYPEVFTNNPNYDSSLSASIFVPSVRLCIQLFKDPSPYHRHLSSMYFESFYRLTGQQIRQTSLKGAIYLSQLEKQFRPADKPYWIVCAGKRISVDTKNWSEANFQVLVKKLTSSGINVVQIGNRTPDMAQPLIPEALDLIDKTSIRSMLGIIANAEGVISYITSAMHAAVALDIPTVTIAGGIEDRAVYDYQSSSHLIFENTKSLCCCASGGCWRTRIPRCIKPVFYQLEIMSECMIRIEPSTVFDQIVSKFILKHEAR